LFFPGQPDILLYHRGNSPISNPDLSQVMKHTLHSRRARGPRGFTLIELLVVITIVALLVTGAFGAYGFVMDRAKRADAQGMCITIYSAIDEFHKDYDRMPEPMSATKDTDCQSDTSAEEGLVWTLLGEDITQNSKKMNYLGDIKDAKTFQEKRVNGMYRTDESAALYDPWGNYYKVTIDLDHNDKIDNPNQEELNGGSPELRKNAIVYTAGKDLKEETWKDNVSSWSSVN
jgi:prepilin-type N-terminal cleavage/methylation domain-containing protein